MTLAMNGDGGLTVEEQEKLRACTRTLVRYTTVVRAREIAKDAKLLGKEGARATPADLKRYIPDADRLGKILIDAFADRGKQRSALATIARLGEEAFRSTSADERLHVFFTKAKTALAEGDWERLAARLGKLREVGKDSDADLVAIVEIALAATSFDLSRLRHALGPAPRLRPPTLRPAPRDVPPPPSSTPRLQVPTGAPAATGTPSVATSTAPAEISWREYGPAARDFMRDVGGPIASVEPPEPTKVLTALAGLMAVLGVERPAALPDLIQVEPVLETFGRLTRELAKAFGTLEDTAGALRDSAAKQLASLSEFVDGQVAQVPATIDATLQRVRGLRSEFATLEPEIVRDATELSTLVEKIPAWDGWSRSAAPPSRLGMKRALSELAMMLREARLAVEQQLQEEAETFAVRPSLPPSETPPLVERSDGVQFTAGRKLPKTFPTAPLFAHALKSAGPTIPAGARPYFVPISTGPEDTFATFTTTATTDEAELTVAAANLLRNWMVAAAEERYAPSRLLEWIADARVIQEATDDKRAIEVFGHAVVGLALESCAADRTRASGRRRRNQILDNADGSVRWDALIRSVSSVANRAVVVRACAELIANGFGEILVPLLLPTNSRDALAGRALAGAIAAALAGLDLQRSVPFIRATLLSLGIPQAEVEGVEDYLEDVQRKRRGTTAIPDVSGPGIVGDFVRDVGARFRERGAQNAQVNVSLPQNVRGIRFYAPTGAQSIDFPLLISSSGPAGAAGIEIVLQALKKRGVESPVGDEFIEEQHVGWLSDVNLRQSANVLVPCRVRVQPDRIGSFDDVELAARISWLGGPRSTTPIAIPLTREPTPIAFKEVQGIDGEPVLLRGATLERSSKSVRDCFERHRTKLIAGGPVRAMVLGRRRRGKSSISRSLSEDPEVKAKWRIVRDQLNSAPLESFASAVERLASRVAEALRLADVDVETPEFTAPTHDRLASDYQTWLHGTCRAVTQPVRVLLLLDEFQRWISKLPSRDVESLLNLFREFNEAALGNVHVSYIVFGLRNLDDLTALSDDFRNGTDRAEIKPLTQDETDAYLDEVLEPTLDGRAKRRLFQLSGGNPYILNRLGARLQEYLRVIGRGWATSTDIEAVVEDPDVRDGRLDNYLAYIIREEEEDNAATLHELTTLRGVASLLDARRDYGGSVRTDELLAWLGQKEVPHDEAVVREHLQELVRIGILEATSGRHTITGGEWVCRQLATMTADLQPVTRAPAEELVLNRYRKKGALGRGLQSEVYLAENVAEGGHDVVLKIYPPGRGTNLEALIEREQRLLRKIHHPCVVKCFGAQVDPKAGGVVMLQHIEGRSLQEIFETAPPEASALISPGGDIELQIRLFEKVADALAECHAHGIAHKDISPANVMVGAPLGEWTPTIIDFGIAAQEGETDSDGHTATMYSPGYTAPEKVKSGRRSMRSDIWSLAMIIVRTVTGKDPTSPGFDVTPTLDGCNLRPALVALLRRMLDDEPANRPTATEVRDGLAIALRPVSWQDLYADADKAFRDDRYDDAAALVLRALNTASPAERTSKDYVVALDVTATLIVESANVDAAWLREVHARMLEAASSKDRSLPDTAWKTLASQLSSATRSREERDDLLRTWIDQIDAAPRVAGLTTPLAVLGELAQGSSETIAAGYFDVVAEYGAMRIVDASAVQSFCDVRAELAAARDDITCSRNWLRRATCLGQAPSATHTAIEKRFAPRVAAEAADPIPWSGEVDVIIGKEEGHTGGDRLRRFAERLHRRCSFVRGIQRINHHSGTSVPRPTLLPLGDPKLRTRKSEDAALASIPAYLDGRYTEKDGLLEVRILLHKDTSAAQREAAFRELAAQQDLFDVRT